MTKKPKSLEKVKESLLGWSKDRDIADFIKERLGLKTEGQDKTHAEELIDNVISKAKYEDEPKWTTVLFNQIKEEKVKEVGGNISIYTNAAAVTDETLTKLINVTPVKKETKIEELI